MTKESLLSKEDELDRFVERWTEDKSPWDVKHLRDYPKEMDHIEKVWEAFLMTHAREELFFGAQERGVSLMPVNDAKSVVEDVGLKARGWFVDVEHPELGETIKYPGGPYGLSETPWRISKRAPLIGEHNAAVYVNELGFSEEQLALLRAKKVV